MPQRRLSPPIAQRGTSASRLRLRGVKPRSAAQLERLLKDAGVDVASWGTGAAKTVTDLWEEIRAGESALIPSRGRLVRILRVVDVEVLAPSARGPLVLSEEKQVYRDGRTRRRNRRSVSEKLKPGETPSAGARRALAEELGIDSRRVELMSRGRATRTEDSVSYPGLPSRYAITKFRTVLPQQLYAAGGYVERQKDKSTYFAWRRRP